MSALSRVSSLGQGGGGGGSGLASGDTSGSALETTLWTGPPASPGPTTPSCQLRRPLAQLRMGGAGHAAGHADRAPSPLPRTLPGTRRARCTRGSHAPRAPQTLLGAGPGPSGHPHLLSCLWRASSLLSTSPRDRRPGLERGMLRRLGAGAGQRGSSWYWRPRLSPQKLKMLDTPEKAPGARELG